MKSDPTRRAFLLACAATCGTRVLAYSLAQHEVIRLLEEHRKSKDIAISSPICLQNHGSPVWFRDLKVRRL